MCWEISYLTNTRGQLNLSGQGRPIPGASPCQALGGRGRPEQPSVPQSQRQPAAFLATEPATQSPLFN